MLVFKPSEKTSATLVPSLNQLFERPVISPHVESPLSSVAYHHDTECIRRLFAEGFPMHLAIHRVDAAESLERNYVELHAHQEPEINVIIPDEAGIVYRVQIGQTVYRIDSTTSIWIPSNIMHSANVVRGSGYYLALRIATPLQSAVPP